ncbi:MAG: hypothetical protein AAF614_10175 [Chloroflexota bacterium]
MLNKQAEISVIELQKVGQPSVAAMKAVMNRFGSAYAKRNKAEKGRADAFALKMLADFAQNGLVRSEPSVFGASVSDLVAPISRTNIKKAIIKNFAAQGVVRQEIAPFGVSVKQIVGAA